jgi:hypothetical protein
MLVLGKVLRTISLSILFGGSLAIVFAAIVLVHAFKSQGLSGVDAAATNAPVFITYAKVNLAFGILLLVGEALDYATRKIWNPATAAQYACSLLCVVSTMIFALAVVPPMERLLPQLKEQQEARQQFHQLHDVSRTVFGATIGFALASLLLPIFGALPAAEKRTEAEDA